MSKEYFNNNPQVGLLYQTSDGYLFEKEVDAKQHAKTLEDKNVKEVKLKGKESKAELKDPEPIKTT